MKILFINPPVFNDLGQVLTMSPPLGLLYLASYLEKNGYKDIKIIDADMSQLSWDMLKEKLIEEKPDIVGITGVSRIMPAVIKTAELTRNALPDKKIIVGGFGATVEPERVLGLARGAIDFVVIGEGELTLLELVQKIERGVKDFSGVKGIAYLDENNQFIKTERREYIKDLDSIPWPAYHLFDGEFSKYAGMPHDWEGIPRPVAVIVTTRGCPHRCTFCSLGSKMYRERSIKDSVDEIEFYKNKFAVKSVQLYDDEFIGMSPKQNERVEAFCDEIIKRGLHKELAFLVQGRCSDYINLKTLKKMREANFVWIWWGVESGSPKILEFIKKDIKIENVLRVFSLAKQAGIKSLMFIMIGFPKETAADIKLTANLIKKIKPDRLAIHIVTPFPGSELRKYLEDHNLLDCTDYYKFDTRLNINHHTEEMTAEEIKKYYKMLIFRFQYGQLYCLKLFLKSLATIDGWKKFFDRTKIGLDYLSARF